MTAAATASAAEELPVPRSFHDVPGWFYNTDLVLFDWFLSRQKRLGQRGDLLEMGAYMGKSAVLMRSYLRDDELFTVCDLFDSDAPDEHNKREMRGSYSTLTRRSFETNFLSFHDELPRIIQAPTLVVPEQVTADSCRFVHVDASHLYEHVQPDIAASRQVLSEDGLVVLDDYRSSHTPGVACATWQAVLEGGLRPVCVSNNKFYGTWGNPGPIQDQLHAELKERGDFWLQWQDVAGHRLLLVGGGKAAPPPLPLSRHANAPGGEAGSGPEKGTGARKPGTSGGPAARPAAPGASRRPRSRARRVAIDVLPPALTRALLRARKQRGR
ncbi:class I SAM-dependent methyltransferase [Streptomyces sp. N2-109]|uniref:Class I SAM-dependent methyltransferase n=1 Tax=Streptomyces gossypii TaxID=2883101 RepID=A0ABT2JTV6_9ACTN|nr:class I SAM-dependent methyltransferase [Streptomyces gossypii]MCT2591317.1 class I SAM-dependent methyltransferase [Streptomyces gossypii]